jgi:hypothetical protein
MSWNAFRLVLRLQGPLHVGWRKVGNLLMTRPYLTGRALWGAFTARIARDFSDNPTIEPRRYVEIGKRVHEELAFSYFFPALRDVEEGRVQVCWPWVDPEEFRYRLLGSYVSTAVEAATAAAEEASLHEVEFISPRARDTGQPVFLLGYVFQKATSSLQWRDVLDRLQFGGERSYGWGRIQSVAELLEPVPHQAHLFDSQLHFDGSGARPHIIARRGARIPAHVRIASKPPTAGEPVQGTLEPLVGREWRRSPGERLSDPVICYAPGARVLSESRRFVVTKFGIWEFPECGRAGSEVRQSDPAETARK